MHADTIRNRSLTDRLLIQGEQMLRTLAGVAEGTLRPSPTAKTETTPLDEKQATHVVGLMRVNHTGEVMAQALYYGQMLTLKETDPLHQHLQQAAREEADHLHWCAGRIHDLGGRTSLLNPVWYAGAFTLGAAAGVLGRGYSLGFTAEVERQVNKHLAGHLAQLPEGDAQTRAVLEQMQADEDAHRQRALDEGGQPLPRPAKFGLEAISKIMTSLAYRI